MKCDWQVIEHIFALFLVIGLHVVIQCLFVAQKLVVLEMVM